MCFISKIAEECIKNSRGMEVKEGMENKQFKYGNFVTSKGGKLALAQDESSVI
jgi:hypothetical protein